ncbi:MAG TPA: DUF6691 family protein [Kofleriaceae bacterium]|nr:DUF6691 family protein [Kofleriaceae bacterium]
MREGIVAFASGLVFALGLAVSGMTQPAKVVGFLDVTGAWDPSLGLVMAGALAVVFVAQRVAVRRPAPLFAPAFPGPPARVIDLRLLGGAAIFGVGWGMSGFCPGPALVSLGAGMHAALVFVPAVLAGMVLFQWVERLSPSPVLPDEDPGAPSAPPARLI